MSAAVAVSHASRIKRLLLATAQYGGIVLGTLIAADVACNALGVFPPTYEYGDPTVGWVAAPPMGVIGEYGCTEYSSGVKYTYTRNEDGVRTRFSAHQLVTDSERDLIAVTGDSQTDLCAPNEQTHPGVLESVLNANGLRAVVLPYGAGRYSPLQDYLVFKKTLLKYHPDAFVLNLYTGNDFYDMLRVDDRPYFVRTDSGYAIAPPVWYQYDSPGPLRHSRVLFALHSFGKRTGIHGFVWRLRLLWGEASAQKKGLPTVLGYLNDLRKSREPSVGYSGAFAALMLNQQLFFHRFPASRVEAIHRMRAVLQMIRRENPDLLLILSPLPSYQLTQQQPVDDALLHTLARLPRRNRRSTTPFGSSREKAAGCLSTTCAPYGHTTAPTDSLITSTTTCSRSPAKSSGEHKLRRCSRGYHPGADPRCGRSRNRSPRWGGRASVGVDRVHVTRSNELVVAAAVVVLQT